MHHALASVLRRIVLLAALVAPPALAVPYALVTTITLGVPGTVTIVDVPTGSVVGSVDLGFATPEGVALERGGRYAWISDRQGRVYKIDLGTAVPPVASLAATIPLPGSDLPRGIAVDPLGEFVYVADGLATTLYVIRTSDSSVSTITVGALPHGVAVDPTNTWVYVTNEGDDNVSVISTATKTVVATVPVGASPVGVTFNPAGTRAYVANNFDDTITVIDPAGPHAALGMPIPVAAGPYGVAASADGKRLYISSCCANAVTEMNVQGDANSVTDETPVGDTPSGISVDTLGRYVVTVNTHDSTVSIVDTSVSPKTVNNIPMQLLNDSFGVFITHNVPAPPANPAATAGNAQATVTFIPPALDGGTVVTGYTVTSLPAGGVDTNAGTTGTSHVVTGLTNGTSYTFTVAATNAIGTGQPSAASNAVVPKTIPAAPAAPTATAGNAQASVTFTAPASDGGSPITGYTVTSIPAGGVDSNAGSTSLTHIVTGLANGTSYTFTVTATNAAGPSLPSAPSNAVTPATVPGAPATPTATAGNAQATVTFAAPASNGGSAITGYTVTSSPAGGVDTNAGSTSLTHVITGLANGTAYTFTVTATNAIGPGAPSAPSNGVTPTAPPGVPGAPTAVTATAGNAQAAVTFTVPASNGGSPITGYTVTSIPAGGVDTNAGSTGTSHVITGLTNGTSYTFIVTATNAVGAGAASTPSNAVTPATAPGAPTSVVATAGNAQATVTFNAPASNGGATITGFTVTSSPAGGVDTNAGGTSTTHVMTGLANGTSYTFTVTATNATGTGAPSAPSNSVVPTNRSFTGSTATGTGIATASFTTSAGGCSFAPQGAGPLQSAFFIPLEGGAKSPPAGSAPKDVAFPHGLLDFVVIGCTPGASLAFTVTYPSPIPANTRYWKYGPTASNPAPHWYALPASIDGNVITFTIVDGGLGDDDLAANGTIVDQGGPGVGGGAVEQIPTLSEWAMALLGALLLLAAARRRPAGGRAV